MIDFKAFRNKNNFTQVDAAKYFGCSQAFIHQIETRMCPTPMKFIEKIKADPLQVRLLIPTENGGIINRPEKKDPRDKEVIKLQKELIKSMKENSELQQYKIESLENEIKKLKAQK